MPTVISTPGTSATTPPSKSWLLSISRWFCRPTRLTPDTAPVLPADLRPTSTSTTVTHRLNQLLRLPTNKHHSARQALERYIVEQIAAEEAAIREAHQRAVAAAEASSETTAPAIESLLSPELTFTLNGINHLAGAQVTALNAALEATRELPSDVDQTAAHVVRLAELRAAQAAMQKDHRIPKALDLATALNHAVPEGDRVSANWSLLQTSNLGRTSDELSQMSSQAKAQDNSVAAHAKKAKSIDDALSGKFKDMCDSLERRLSELDRDRKKIVRELSKPAPPLSGGIEERQKQQEQHRLKLRSLLQAKKQTTREYAETASNLAALERDHKQLQNCSTELLLLAATAKLQTSDAEAIPTAALIDQLDEEITTVRTKQAGNQLRIQAEKHFNALLGMPPVTDAQEGAPARVVDPEIYAAALSWAQDNLEGLPDDLSRPTPENVAKLAHKIGLHALGSTQVDAEVRNPAPTAMTTALATLGNQASLTPLHTAALEEENTSLALRLRALETACDSVAGQSEQTWSINPAVAAETMANYGSALDNVCSALGMDDQSQAALIKARKLFDDNKFDSNVDDVEVIGLNGAKSTPIQVSDLHFTAACMTGSTHGGAAKANFAKTLQVLAQKKTELHELCSELARTRAPETRKQLIGHIEAASAEIGRQSQSALKQVMQNQDSAKVWHPQMCDIVADLKTDANQRKVALHEEITRLDSSGEASAAQKAELAQLEKDQSTTFAPNPSERHMARSIMDSDSGRHIHLTIHTTKRRPGKAAATLTQHDAWNVANADTVVLGEPPCVAAVIAYEEKMRRTTSGTQLLNKVGFSFDKTTGALTLNNHLGEHDRAGYQTAVRDVIRGLHETQQQHSLRMAGERTSSTVDRFDVREFLQVDNQHGVGATRTVAASG